MTAAGRSGRRAVIERLGGTLSRRYAGLQAMEREDVLPDGRDLAPCVLFGPAPGVLRQRGRRVAEGEHLEPEPGHLFVAIGGQSVSGSVTSFMAAHAAVQARATLGRSYPPPPSATTRGASSSRLPHHAS